MTTEKTKNSKITPIIVNTLTVLIILIALVALLFRTSVLGLKFYSVLTGSMDGGYAQDGDLAPSFKKDDLILIKTLSGEEKQNLKVGDIVCFYTRIDDNMEINTHRIMHVIKGGGVTQYITAGDFNLNEHDGGKRESVSEFFAPLGLGFDDSRVNAADIIGVYSSKIEGVGKIVNFFQTKEGFLIFVIVPCLIMLLYSTFLFFKALDNYKKEKYAILMSEKQALNDAKSKEEFEKRLEEELQKRLKDIENDKKT